MSGAWWIVMRKELRETLRDRRTLVMMVVIPVLLYPALLIVTEQLFLFGMRRLESEPSPVALVGSPPAELVELLESDTGLVNVTIDGEPSAALRDGTVGAVAVLEADDVPDGTTRVSLLFDETSDRSQRARGQLGAVLAAWRDSVLATRLGERGLPASFAVPVAVADSSVALPEEVGGYALGRILPLLLVVITLLGAFYPAIDLAAGEKERGTLETLLTAPVPASAIVAGKFATVALIGMVAAALNLGSMLLTFQTGVLQITEVIGLEVALPLSAVALVFLALVPLSVLFGAVFLGLAVRSASFKEAQNALTPVYLLVLVPAMLSIFPGIETGPLLAVMPVAGVSLYFRDLMSGSAGVSTGILVLASTTLYAMLALVFAAHRFGDERVLFGDDESDVSRKSWPERLRSLGRAGRIPEPMTALWFVALLAVLFFFGGVRLQLAFGEAGLMAAQWGLLFLPAVLFVWLGRFDVDRTLSLTPTSARALGSAVLLIGGALPMVWFVSWLQTFVLPIPTEMLEGLQDLVTAQSAGRLVWLLALLALTPSFCEEVVFRGVLLGATRGRVTPWRSIVLNGVIFGAFHLSFESAIRFLPTALLGCLIAWAVWRTGSIWVGVLMHFLNNATIVLIASVPFLQEQLADPEAPPPLWLVPVGAAVWVAGVVALRADTDGISGYVEGMSTE